MDTPICDFVRRYGESQALRTHMPGHKGCGFLGIERLDITEIDGADSLYEASGIIAQSERNAGSLFGCETFYSTEGSSQCIRAMVYLAMLHGKQTGRRPFIAAGRNAHKTFLSAAALLDLDVMWLYPEKQDSYLSCKLDGTYLDKILRSAQELPVAVYVTSPDYLGCLTDLRSIARVCHRYGVLLLVDNAHGAYLKFLPESLHPMDLGADICCDSAHKTLPVLTGGAYLHISPDAPSVFARQAKNALALFGSTSPSYLILQSLDAANAYLADGYRQRLATFSAGVGELKKKLEAHGYTLYGNEPLKISIFAKPYGYEGGELACLLQEKKIVCEFADPDFVVMMLTPETGTEGLNQIEEALLGIPRAMALMGEPPRFHSPRAVMSIRQAALSPAETIAVEQCAGRVLASASVGCPPAVPIGVCGEEIDEAVIRCFRYYGIDRCTVVEE